MSETTNYGLYLTDDSSEKFLDWRLKMNGVSYENSNMAKIDRVLGEKADSSVAINATLYGGSGWQGDSPFYQILAVEGITKSQNGVIDVAHGATPEQREAAREALLSIVEQDDGTITIAADGELPETDIPVCIILLG